MHLKKKIISKARSKPRWFWQAEDPKPQDGTKLKIKCNPVLFIEKKKIRAQQIRAQSYVLHKIKKRMDKREKRKRERRWHIVKSMELNSKKTIQKYKEGNKMFNI